MKQNPPVGHNAKPNSLSRWNYHQNSSNSNLLLPFNVNLSTQQLLIDMEFKLEET